MAALPLAVCMATVFLIVTGCGKPQHTPGSEPAQTTNQVNPEPELNLNDGFRRAAAPVLFSDSSRQKRFEELYFEAPTFFNPPNPGTLVRIFKNSGGRVEGEFTRYTLDGIAISTPDGPVIINRKNMTEDTQVTIYEDTFSKFIAEKMVTFEMAKNIPAGLDDIYFDSELAGGLEKRRITAEYMPARLGPARYFTTNGLTHYRGEIIVVIHETNDWICVKKSADAATHAGWIPKFSSFMTNPEKKDLVAIEVDKLFKSGFLIDIDPKKNVAMVDLYEWRIADTAAVEGKSRLLAIYCGQQKNSRLFWVDIKDALTGKKLAEFSVSKGFKEFH